MAAKRNLFLSFVFRRSQIIIVALIFLTWRLAFTTLSDTRHPPIWHAPSSEWLSVRELSCTDSFWVPDQCGQDGVNCEPFSNRLVAFHCPANCIRDGVVTGKPHLAGGREIIGQPLVIGGPIYRGDSYICPSAIHAGVIDDANGGCGVAKFMGMTNSFSSSYMYDIESIDVQTYFPKSFRFTLESEDMACPEIKHTSWMLPFVSAAHTALVWKATSSSTIRAVWSLAVVYTHLSSRQSGRPLTNSLLSPSRHKMSGETEGKAPIPQILEPVIFMDSISNITFKWATPTIPHVEGISMLVDDVERARRFFGDGAKNELREGETVDSFFWQRTPQAFVDFIRFGYIKDGKVLKYSQPGIWFTNGTWTGIPADEQQ